MYYCTGRSLGRCLMIFVVIIFVVGRAVGLTVWFDARSSSMPLSSMPGVRPTATLVKDDDDDRLENMPTIRIRGSELFENGACIGRVVAAETPRRLRNALNDAVRAAYGVVFIDAPFDAGLVHFALQRCDHCRAISGVDVKIAARVDSDEELDTFLLSSRRNLTLVLPAGPITTTKEPDSQKTKASFLK